MKNLILWLLLLLFIIKFINYGFKLRKTIYTVLWSVIVIIICSLYLVYLNLEFIAISITLIYVGGIFALFLFLIISINDYTENYNFYDKKIDYLVLINTVIFTNFFIFLYQPGHLKFNDYYFISYNLSAFYTEIPLNYNFICFFDNTYDFLFFTDTIFFSDLFIFSYFLFYNFSIHLISIAFLLTISPICSIFIINKL